MMFVKVIMGFLLYVSGEVCFGEYVVNGMCVYEIV